MHVFSRDSRLLVLGLVFSIGLHLAVLMPWLSEAASASENRGIVDLESVLEPPPPEPELEEPVLGIEESMAKTMNWIGYEEYQEHLARLAETDQAAFEMRPSAGGGTPPRPQVPPTPQPTEESTQADSAAAPPSVTAPEQPAKDAPQVPQAAQPTDAEQIETKAPEKPDPEATDGTAGPPRPEPAPEKEPKPEPEPQPKPKPEPEPKPEPKPETDPSPQPKPDPGEGPGSGEGEPGEPGDAADKESDPTSVIEVPPDTWRAGKPLAAQGLELQTKRPFITELTLLTARYGHPLVEIQFGSDGKPKSAQILTSSGDKRIDDPILDSLYRWRAKGAKLKELKGDETANIRLRIVLN